MANTPSVQSIEDLLVTLGRQLGASLAQTVVAGMRSTVGNATGVATSEAQPAIRRGPGRPPKAAGGTASAIAANGTGCRVPGCSRKAEARRLCGSHYGKAQRLKMKLDALSDADLKLLALDGRALRWQARPAKRALGKGTSGASARPKPAKAMRRPVKPARRKRR
jgi:hypothetical protein